MARLAMVGRGRPEVQTLLIALAATVILWFIPFAGLITYPFRIFVTFIHEGGHALAAIVTGNAVQGLQVNPSGSGLTYTMFGSAWSQMLIASAGYLGAMAFGALLLVLIRRAVAARTVLAGTAIFILVLTLRYGWPSLFTIVAGLLLAAGLVAVARWATPYMAKFLVAFLAVQCVMDALFDLRTLLYLSSSGSSMQTDAGNMAQITHLPPFFWALAWTALAGVILWGALRAYVRDARPAPDDTLELPPVSYRRSRSTL